MKNARASVTLIVIAVIALFGAGGYFAVKSGVFNGETKRANENSKTTTELVAANASSNAKAASVFTAIGQVNSEAPESPQKKVINRFYPIGLGLTGKPDPEFLQQLDQLKIAEISGKLEQANAINGNLLQTVEQANLRADRALSAKQRSDDAIQEHAAAERAANAQKYLAIVMAVAALGLYAYAKVTHFSPGQIANYVTDIRSGATEPNSAIAALDSIASPLQQKIVNLLHRWKKF